jgi:hypothetical protein
MANGSDFYGVRIFRIEEQSVVAATEATPEKRRLQLFHIPGAAEQVAVKAVENL